MAVTKRYFLDEEEMIFHLRKFIHYVSSIKSRNIAKGIPFILCIGWLLVKSFPENENTVETVFRDALPYKSNSEFLSTIEMEMSRRKQVAKNVCRREGLGLYRRKGVKVRYPPVPNLEAYFFNIPNKLMWCPIYKSASTSWLYNLCNLAGIDDDYLDHTEVLVVKVARRVYPSVQYTEAIREMNEKLKFFIVRHPFDRLLSAYRDKLEKVIFTNRKHETQYYYKKYGRRIVDKYRRFSSYGNMQRKFNLSDKGKENNTELGVFNASRIEPTFEEFLIYLTDIDLMTQADEHWIPYYIYCTPCSVEYDVIAKFETLDQDQQYIIEKSNLQSKLTPKWKRKTKGGLSSSIAKEYFSTISRSLLLKLYEKYRIDFEMFEYDIEEHLKYTH